MAISKAYSVGNKPNEFVSVKDFGATGDGTTDDTAAIDAAEAAVSAGGMIYFPAGTYIVNHAVLFQKSGVTYQGENRLTTIIKAGTSNKDNVLGRGYGLLDGQLAARLAGSTLPRNRAPNDATFSTTITDEEVLITGGFAGYARTHITMRDLTIDGNKTNVPLNVSNLQGTPSGTFLIGETITWSGGSAQVTGVFSGSVSYEPRSLTGTAPVASTAITGSSSGATMTVSSVQEDDAYQNLVRLEAVSHSTIENCIFKNSVFVGVSLYNDSNNNTIRNNLFFDNNYNGTVTSAAYQNIYLEFNSYNNKIYGNVLIGGLGYSLLIGQTTGLTKNCTIRDNTIINPGSDGIRVSNDSNTGNIEGVIISHNTVSGADATGAVSIRLNHGGASGNIIGAIVDSNHVQDGVYGILGQGNLLGCEFSGNTLDTFSIDGMAIAGSNNSMTNNTANAVTGTDFNMTGTGFIRFGNRGDTKDVLRNQTEWQTGSEVMFRAVRSGTVGFELENQGTSTVKCYNNSSGQFEINIGGAVFTIGSGGNITLPVAGTGIVLKSPDGLTTETLTLDNSGNVLIGSTVVGTQT